MSILRIENLVKHYSNHKAVDEISFEITEGNIFGLLGPNGAGKTTLIRMITGIIYPDRGNIFFQGKKFSPTEDIYKIGYMPEERGLYKKMEVGEQALYLARLKGMSRRDAMKGIKEWFAKFEMDTWWNKKVDDLSKGMSQKLQFVITVLHAPPLLILDEPFSGLDPVNSNLIKEEIFRLSKTGTTVIFSTHRMEQVEEICNRIILVNKGKKILDGDITEIKSDFKEGLFKLGFTGSPNQFHPVTFQLIAANENEWSIRIRDGITTTDVLMELIERGVQIHSFNEVLPTLNQIFIKQVEELASTPAFSDQI